MKRRNFLKALPAAALALAGCGQAETAPANTASLVFDRSYPLDQTMVAVILPSATVRAAGLSTVARPEPPSRVTSQV